MKTYTTFQGARRAARIGGSKHFRPILRILNSTSTDDLFVVLDDMKAELFALDPETGKADGRIVFLQLSTKGQQ